MPIVPLLALLLMAVQSGKPGMFYKSMTSLMDNHRLVQDLTAINDMPCYLDITGITLCGNTFNFHLGHDSEKSSKWPGF